MAPVNCRRCDRFALVLDGHLECAACREERTSNLVSGQLLEGLEKAETVAELAEAYREEHKRVFGDPVNHPAHYNQFGVEVIDIIEMYFPNNYHLANACKYLLRSGYKGHEIEDLRKLVWYVERYIDRKESGDAIPAISEEQGDS